LDKLYPAKFPARVTITLDNGASFTETALLPKGDPGAPLSDEELVDKFLRNCRAMLVSDQVEQLREVIFGLPEAASIGDLTKLLMRDR
jgi:2-methylcitrate dehydratase PrpD